MRDVVVAAEREALVESLRCGVLLCLEACQQRPTDREDPDQRDEPGEDSDPEGDGAALADSESRAALHARSSSLKRLERTRRAKVAMMIEKMTTTIAYADADPYRKPPPIDSW